MTFSEYIISKMNTPFKWGENDCVLFAVKWIEIATCKKHLPDELWKDEKQARRLVKQKGGLENVFDKHFTRINPNFAQDGNLAESDGVCYLFSGAHIVAPGENGLIFKSRTEAKNAWTY